ncbi:hypothetical protein [Agromyces sp. Leaf222]|uniref:hypothetical protein n=1 Tax=Agromyces sp. Leaf222 TaxID=1735688 RepID=UPI0006F1D939|nr:hypothetical protein [Agromyces sp. Leaf222]KQM82184.1 hypothetical protein ASE68_01815 [Agromyces sp. Leaf222]
MPEPDADLARLQRLAFGSGASDAERADAARELDALREARSAAAVEAEVAAGEPPAEPEVQPAVTPVAADSVPSGRLRGTIIVGLAALVVGLLAGWQLGTTLHATAESAMPTPTATPFTDQPSMADSLAEQPLAGEASAADVFLRPATEADAAPLPPEFGFGNGSLEYRLLATRPDGTLVFLARDAAELCVVVAFPDLGGAASTCTVDGRFPEKGLNVATSVSADDTPTSIDVTLAADGRLTFGTVTGP